MHITRRTYEHPRTGPAAILIGVLLMAVGIAMDGHAGVGLRTVGVVLILAGIQHSNTMVIIRSGYAVAHRDGYRRGRRVGKPVVVPVPQEHREQKQAALRN